MAEPRHHSIGEVLSLLKEEHKDVTISKIRFFESQGLIDPERTPSGYRKFYDHDIERLRWILTQQRDNFLPLKVIKRRLEEAGFDPAAESAGSEEPLPEPTLFSRRDHDGAEAEGGDDGVEIDLTDDRDEPTRIEDSAPEAESEPDPPEPDPPEPDPEPAREMKPVAPAPAIAEGDPLAEGDSSVSMGAGELADAAGVDLGLVGDLERLGLIRRIGGEAGSFDHEALVVARAAAVFNARGVEARHLRMFKVAAERQAGLLEQLLGPKLLKGGDDRREARDQLNELVRLGEAVQRSVLRRSFGSHLDVD